MIGKTCTAVANNAPAGFLAFGAFFKWFEPVVSSIAALVAIAWAVAQFRESKTWKDIKKWVRSLYAKVKSAKSKRS